MSGLRLLATSWFITKRATNPNVSETPNPGGAPTVKTSKADTYKEIYVTGQIANLTL